MHVMPSHPLLNLPARAKERQFHRETMPEKFESANASRRLGSF
jgi:hypothetical protein